MDSSATTINVNVSSLLLILLGGVTKKKVKTSRRKNPQGTNFQGHYQHGDFVEALDCDYGQACNMLRKKWIKFKMAKRNSDELSLEEAKEEINNIQNILGISVTLWRDDYEMS